MAGGIVEGSDDLHCEIGSRGFPACRPCMIDTHSRVSPSYIRWADMEDVSSDSECISTLPMRAKCDDSSFSTQADDSSFSTQEEGKNASTSATNSPVQNTNGSIRYHGEHGDADLSSSFLDRSTDAVVASSSQWVPNINAAPFVPTFADRCTGFWEPACSAVRELAAKAFQLEPCVAGGREPDQLAYRKKQVEIVKRTREYQNLTEFKRRVEIAQDGLSGVEEPKTPDIYDMSKSRRRWKYEVQQWRLQLRGWQAEESSVSTDDWQSRSTGLTTDGDEE